MLQAHEENGVQRTLGRIEGALKAQGVALGELKGWTVDHLRDEHGNNSPRPRRGVSRQTVETTGILGVLLVLVEVVSQVL